MKGCHELVEGHASVLANVASADPGVHAGTGRTTGIVVGDMEMGIANGVRARSN